MCGERYVPKAIGLIRSLPVAEQSRQYRDVFNAQHRFSEYKQETQDQIMGLGFMILKAEAKPGTPAGYELAQYLGAYLHVPGAFAPDGNAAKYWKNGRKDMNGQFFTDQFFTDTVQNALDWAMKTPKFSGTVR